MPDHDPSAGEASKPLAASVDPNQGSEKQSKPLTEPQHVDLNDPYYKTSRWTNKKEDLELDTYFHPLRPNLGQDFGIAGLRPVIKDTRQGDFLLMDNNKRFYTWNPEEGQLWRVIQQGLEPSQAADLAMNGFIQGTDLQLMAHSRYKR